MPKVEMKVDKEGDNDDNNNEKEGGRSGRRRVLLRWSKGRRPGEKGMTDAKAYGGRAQSEALILLQALRLCKDAPTMPEGAAAAHSAGDTTSLDYPWHGSIGREGGERYGVRIPTEPHYNRKKNATYFMTFKMVSCRLDVHLVVLISM